MNENEKKQDRPGKLMIYYYVIAISTVLLINWFLFPAVTGTKIVEAEYSQFLQQVNDQQVVMVEIQNDYILYKTDVDENENYFKTDFTDDPELLQVLKSQNVEFGQIGRKKPDYLVSLIICYILPISIILIDGFMKKNKTNDSELSSSEEKSGNKINVTTASKTTFAEVAGQDEAKESLAEVVDYLSNPEKYAEIGAKCPKGILLVGPPGTGKTLMAKAVAGEANVPFFASSGSEFVEMYVGRGAARVRELFEKAKKKAPCIVFIDEIDTVGKKRNSSLNSNEEREQTLNQLLTEMDGFEDNKGVLILAATNRPETLDPALLRPGRFDRQVRVELPDMEGRISILKVHAQNYKMEEKIDYNLIARATSGASGAQLANIVNEGALRAVRMGRAEVSHADLEESIEVVIAGEQKKNAILSLQEKKIVSYHEIGHAILAAKQTNSAPVHKITIVPRTSGALGYTMQVETRDKTLLTRTDAMNKIATYCGGRAAEELVFGEYTTGASNDIEQATKIARAMVTKYGMTDKFDMMALETGGRQYLGGDSQLSCSPETAQLVDRESLSIIKEAHARAAKILKDNEKKLHELANYLFEKETITGEQFMEILQA